MVSATRALRIVTLFASLATSASPLCAALAALAVPTSAAAQTAPAPTPVPVAEPATPQALVHREYLQRFVVVLDGIRRTLRWVEQHPSNEALARFSLPLAQQYVTMTGHMTPSEDLRLLHPHLLLIAENAERAIAGLGAGDARSYRAHARTVREELRTLQSVLHHLEIELPEIPR